MIVRLRPLVWEDIRPTFSVTSSGPMGYATVDFYEPGERERFDEAAGQWEAYPSGWYYECTWDHGDEQIGIPMPCDSLAHGKECVEASYLAHLKPAFDFVE